MLNCGCGLTLFFREKKIVSYNITQTVVKFYFKYVLFSFTVVRTINLSAQENEDYQPLDNSSLAVPAKSNGIIPVTIIDDDVMKWMECFVVEITGVAVGGGLTRVNVTIVDNDRK